MTQVMTQAKQHSSQLPIIGWREWLALPALGIPAIKTKIDTGARTSALHAFELETFRRYGVKHVRFSLHPLRRRSDIVITCTACVIDERVVIDSGGHREHRYVISTLARLGEQEWPLELTLTDRENMLFRMLLGRTALESRFLVDPQASYLYGRRLRRAYSTQRTHLRSETQKKQG